MSPRYLLLMGLAALAPAASLAQGPLIFTPGSIDRQQLNAEFQGAVLLLQSAKGTPLGTGFLINQQSGYILTATHVVEAAQKLPDGELFAVSPGNESLVLKTKVVAQLPSASADVALLQLVIPDALKAIRPLDIVLKTPSQSMAIYAMGYPVIDPNLRPTYQDQVADRMSLRADGSIQVNQASFEGNSGGPLVDATGSAFAVCRDKIGTGSTVAVYTSLYTVYQLLLNMPLTERMKEIDARVQARSITPDDLARLMIKSAQNPTNVELFAWGMLVARDKTKYQHVFDLFEYPVLPAFMHRGLDKVVVAMSGFGKPLQQAEANLSVATSEAEFGFVLSAMQHADTAIAYYKKAGDATGEARAHVVSAQVRVAQEQYLKAAEHTQLAYANVHSLPVPEQGILLDVMGRVARAEGKFTEASSLYSEATRAFVSSGRFTSAGRAFAERAKTKLQTGDNEGAQYDLNSAAFYFDRSANKPEKANALYALAGIQLTAGQTQRAATTLNRYVAELPESEAAKEREALAMLRKAQDDGSPLF